MKLNKRYHRDIIRVEKIATAQSPWGPMYSIYRDAGGNAYIDGDDEGYELDRVPYPVEPGTEAEALREWLQDIAAELMPAGAEE